MKTFAIMRRQAGPATVLDLEGRITLGESSRALRTALQELSTEGRTHILLDLAAVSHLDSSGLGSLLVGYNSLRTQGGSIGLLRVPRHIQELLELSRLTSVFQIFDTEEEALTGLGEPSSS